MEKIVRVNQEIPLDLLLEILAKLPVKSLCRFRCVCRLWGSVIGDPRFEEAHRACSAARPKLLLLFRGHKKRVDAQKLEYHAYTCELDATGMELQSPDDHRGLARTSRNLVAVQKPLVEGGCISPQVDGLYCLAFSHAVVRLWNPNTRESLDIKTVETERDYKFCSLSHFGFDPVEKKHKVLNILLTKPWYGKVLKSRVFILEENCWRPTANAHPPHLVPSTAKDSICIDGILFYLYFPYASGPSVRKLMAFHVRLETFEDILFPEAYEWTTLIEFAGRAALVKDDFSQGITLWVLEDLQQHFWRKLKERVVPNYDLKGLILKGGTPTGELLFIGRGKPFFVLLYNVESNTARRIELQGLHLKEIDTSSIDYVKVHFHVESLRSPKGVASGSINRTYHDPQQIEV